MRLWICKTPISFFARTLPSQLVAEADAFLGYRSSVRESWRGPVSNAKRRLLYLRRQSDATISVLRTMLKSLKALYNSAEARPDTTRDERLKDEFSRTLPSMLRTAWAINRVDITHALRGACEKLFHDADVSSREERLRRVEAVRVLGSQFYSVGMESAAAMGGTATSQGRGDVDEIKVLGRFGMLSLLLFYQFVCVCVFHVLYSVFCIGPGECCFYGVIETGHRR